MCSDNKRTVQMSSLLCGPYTSHNEACIWAFLFDFNAFYWWHLTLYCTHFSNIHQHHVNLPMRQSLKKKGRKNIHHWDWLTMGTRLCSPFSRRDEIYFTISSLGSSLVLSFIMDHLQCCCHCVYCAFPSTYISLHWFI